MTKKMARRAFASRVFSLSDDRPFIKALEVMKARTEYKELVKMKTSVWNVVAHNFDHPMINSKAKAFAQSFCKIAELGTATAVLETTGGSGVQAEVYESSLPENATLTLTDAAEAFRKYWEIRKLNLTKTNFEVADGHELPYKDETFDRYLTCSGISQFIRPDIAIKEAYRVLKPGGIFVGNMPIDCSYEVIAYVPLIELGVIPKGSLEMYLSNDNKAFLRSLCEEAGFEDCQTFEDVYTSVVDFEGYMKYFKQMGQVVIPGHLTELRNKWETITAELLHHFLKERHELLTYKAVGIRAVKPRA